MRPIPEAPCLGLIHVFEGRLGNFESKAIKDPAGNWEIGWSHKLPGPTDEVWTQAQADQQVLLDLEDAAAGVCAAIGDVVALGLTEGQYAALIDFTYNVGVSAFSNSTLCLRVRSGQLGAVPAELEKWKYGRVNGVETVLMGLVARRAAEVRVWLT